MKSRILFSLLATLLLVSVTAQAQQPAKVPRIAWLSGTYASSPNIDAFRQGLRELGYIEGKNIIVEWRFAEGDRVRQRTLAAELVELKVDVIVASGGCDTRAAKELTTTIPIVMAQTDDPIASGFVASLARPGGNITGLSTLAPELSGKRLEILKETVPKLTRVAVFSTSNSPGNGPVLKEVKLAAAALGITAQILDVLSPKDFDMAFRSASKARAGALLWIVSGAADSESRATVTELAVQHRIPAIYEREAYVAEGGMMSYGVNLTNLARRAATYVDKILKGAKPGEIPVEQPTKFEFVVNLKAAKAINLTIPPNVLARADRVIR